MANSDETEVQCLFERKPRPTEHFTRMRTKKCACNPTFESDITKMSCHSMKKSGQKITRSTKKYTQDNSVYIYVHKKKRNNNRKRREYNIYQYSKNEIIFMINSKRRSNLPEHYSLLELASSYNNKYLRKMKSSKSWATTNEPFNRNYIVNNCCRSCDKPECGNPFTNPQVLAKIYRCQTAAEDTCCCSCNSDAMFEVMKSLYDCYKKKNCENCRCILCGFGKEKKSVGVGEEEAVEAALEGKTEEEKEKILKDLAISNKPFPKPKNDEERALMDKIRRDLGLPPEPTNSTERKKFKKAYKDGIIEPLEGKTPKEKEKILKRMLKAGLPLPEGRTPSEVKIINSLKAAGPSMAAIASENFEKARAEGLLTPLDGKPPEQQEKIIRGLAKQGLPLPKGKTASQKDLINKIRDELGLPPEPKKSAERAKLRQGYADGIVTPLVGKTPEQKEQALRKMAAAGIPLPEGRTPSEKALIDNVKATTIKRPTGIIPVIPSEKLKKAKAEGFLTPLVGKTPEQQEKILKGLAKHGIPLPEGKTASQKKLIDKVRQGLGLPPEPKTSAERNKLRQAYVDGVITPLEGKTPEQKEKALQKMVEAGIPLPEGRTPSEKALINKIKAVTEKRPTGVPSDKFKKAQAEGLITPLEGKTPEQKDKILKGLAVNGIPLPEGKTPSEKALIDTIRKDMGLPPAPTSSAERQKLNQAYADGIITPLEGKTPEQKEQALRKMAAAGIPLPEGRTPSEKALIDTVKATTEKRPTKTPSGIPSEKLKKAKAEGFLTPLIGKTPEQQDKILKGLAKHGIPLPEGKTASQKKLIDKVRQELGLPPEPKTSADKRKLRQAYVDGVITPLEGKTPEQKEKALKKMAEAGIPLPEGRTPSEKALIDKIRDTVAKRPSGIPSGILSEKLRKAKADGLITPLAGKTPEQKEKILKGLAVNGIPLPEGKTPSEKALIDKMRKDMGLPPVPKNSAERKKNNQAYTDGIITPLEGKTPEQKEQALRKMAAAGIPLPEGRTPSEKALIDNVKATAVRRPSGIPSGIPSEKLRKAKAEGLITPLVGKTPEQKEKILKGLAKIGIPLPEGKTPSEKALIDKVREDMGLPTEPKTSTERKKLKQAYADGVVTPLEGKTPEEKEKVLRRIAAAGLPLPEGRTPSEKALIDNVKTTAVRRPSGIPSGIPSEKLRKAKAEGLITPLVGKTPEQKEKILKGLAKIGIPLPEGKTPSEKALIDKVREDMGLPTEPKTSTERKKLKQAYADGVVTPLEGKTPEEKEKVLRRIAAAGLPLPEGRTSSEKALIDNVKATAVRKPSGKPSGIPSKNLRKAKAEGYLTPLKGKTPEQKEKILKGLAKHGIPLPEGTTPSEKKLIDKVREDLGLPPEPKTSAERKKIKQAYAAGIITPLEGKTPEQKEKTLQKMAEAGIPLPEGRTPSEKALIDKVKATTVKRPTLIPSGIPSEKIKKAKVEGFITPLAGKTPEQKDRILRGLAKNGIPLPEGKTPSEKALIDTIRKDLGLPVEPKSTADKIKLKHAYAQGLITPLEGKTPSQKENTLRKLKDAGIPLPEGRTPSEQALVNKIRAERPKAAPSEKLRKAKEAGLLTPLEGKTPEQKEKILKGLADLGLPLPDGKTPSEKKLIDKVREDMGLPPEPKTPSEKVRLAKLYAKGLVTPLEGKTPEQKESILKRMAENGITLPEGRTPSEKALIAKVKAVVPKRVPPGIPSEKLKKAKAEGFITPLEGKTPEQKDKILRGLTKHGIPLPEGKTSSEKKLIDKIRQDLGLPPEPKTSAEKRRLQRAYADGIVTPLEGKTPEQKEKALRKMAEAGIPMPEGRTPSEKALIDKVKARTEKRPSEIPPEIPSEKIRKAKAEGFITPLAGKTPEQKEKILKGLANNGIPLPEAKTPSEKKIIDKIRQDLGLPPEPKTSAEKRRLQRAYADGIVTPLEGKTPEQKEEALRKMAEAGIPMPEGRTPSEKALIDKVKARTEKRPSEIPPGIPSEKLRKAKAEGFITPLAGKTPKQKENILKGLANNGIPLPEGKTPSEKKIIDKIRQDLGLPPEPKTSAEKRRLQQAYVDGIVTPLEGKTPEQKEKALRKMAEAGIPLPEGRTPSENALITKLKKEVSKKPSGVPSGIPSEKLSKAKAEGLLTPLTEKSPEQKEKILKGLAKNGIPLPEGKTPSEQNLIDKVRQELGLPAKPKTSEEKRRLDKAYADGIVTPLEGKTPAQKEAALRKMAEAGIPLPEGRTPSEKALVNEIKAIVERKPTGILTEKFEKAKAAGIITPLAGKTPEQKKTILQGLAASGIPFPEGKTRSEKKLMDEVRNEMGLPPLPKTASEKGLMSRAYAEGIITPLEGKTPEQKEKALTKMLEAGVPLPEGRTASEKALIEKVKAKGPRSTEIKRRLKEKGISAKPTGIEAQELEEITKTTKCDRACGCDRKKIRFKHSYVKIRVTSPDISSFCDCPDECIPGVKGGVFVDNEGIKVTIGFSSVLSGFQSKNSSISKIGVLDSYPNQKCISFYSAALGSDASILKTPLDYSQKYKNKDYLYLSKEDNVSKKEESKDLVYGHTSRSLKLRDDIETFNDNSSIYMISSKVSNNTSFTVDSRLAQSSYDSIVLLGTESSLSLSVDSFATELATISVLSFDSSTVSDDNINANTRLSLHLAESRLKNIISNADHSTESIHPYLEDIKTRCYNNNQVTILRFTRTKKSKSKDKKKEKKVIINEPDSENIMKIVAEEILNQTQKSDSSSVFVVVQSEDDTNTDMSSVPSQSMKKDPIYKLRESYPIVASEHQLLVASRGVKLISTPRDMTELVPAKQKRTKTRKRSFQGKFSRASSKSENEIDYEETEIIKKETKKSDEVLESSKNKINNRPYFDDTQVCTYHKNKNAQKIKKQKGTFISLEPKQQFLGFDLNVHSGASQTSQLKPRYLKLSKPNNVHQVIETTKSLKSVCQKSTEIDIKNQQKSTEIVPDYKPKGLDTSCDRPCSCACELKSEIGSMSSPAISEMYGKGLTELSADAFIRNSIPYLYQARQYVSPYSSPSDAEPCKCCPKFNTTDIDERAITNEYNKPISELWIDYGAEQHQNIVSKYASPSDLLPCECCTKNTNPEQQYYQTERIACSPNADRLSMDSKYCEQKQNLQRIKQSFHSRFKDRIENMKQSGVTHQPNNQYPAQKMPQPVTTSYEAEYARRAATYPEHLQTDQYMAPSMLYQAPDDTISNAAKHIRTCPNCSKNYKLPSPTEDKKYGQFSQNLPYTDFRGQCPEFSNIVKNQFQPTMEHLTNNATNITYANYTSKGSKYSNNKNRFTTPTTNYKRPSQSSNVTYSNYNGQCPESLNIVERECVRNKNWEQDTNNNLTKTENGSNLFGELRTVHLSQAIIYNEPREVPLEPPPTRRNTKESNDDPRICVCEDDDSNKNNNLNNNESETDKTNKGPDQKMCNECCVRGKIIDCVTPGRPCDPCARIGQVLPKGFKLSNTCHTKLHLRDLLIYEDSSHKCCCITNEDSSSVRADGVADFCIDYCSGETVEDIRDAVERFMKARERGLVCNSKVFSSQNICDETRELCQGIEQIIAEREGAKADENCKCPQTNNLVKHNEVTSSFPKQDLNIEENCKCPQRIQQNAKNKKKPETSIAPLVDIHHVGLRERSRRPKSKSPENPDLCACRFPKDKTPLEECVCPKNRNCECPDVTEQQWFEYFTKGKKMTRRDAMMLQTEMTQTTSGFKFMKNRKFCDEINTYEEALDYYHEHDGLETVGGQIKANPDGTCPGCGDMNCPGLWVPNYFDPHKFDAEKLVQGNLARHAKETDKECSFSKCKDESCPGMGPYGLLPPIPGGAVADVKVTGTAEKKGYHRACTCEPREEFEEDIYCPPEGPVYCECAKGSSVSCECSKGEGEGKGAMGEQDNTKVQFQETSSALKLKGHWDKGPCGPLGGLKVNLPGKGTASTGLQGICCFNALESSYSETSLKSASSNSSTYVVYV